MAYHLCFDWQAGLKNEADEIVLDGSYQRKNWREGFRDEADAAWAFVSKQLNVPGTWYCSVTFEEMERRTIVVELVDGVIFRRDQS